MRRRKLFTMEEWSSIEMKTTHILSLVLWSPIILLVWLARFLDEHLSNFIYWIDDREKDVMWYYFRWKKNRKGNKR